MIKVGMRSLATTVKGQGVDSAYEELMRLLAEYGNGKIDVLRHGLARADVIHAHTLAPLSFLYLRLTRKPTVASVHFMPDTMRGSLRLPWPIQHLFDAYTLAFYRSADYLHIVHPDTARELTGYGIGADRIFCIPNVVSTMGFAQKGASERTAIRMRYGFSAGDFVVMGSGQLQTRKGVDTFARVARELPETRFVWAGGFSFGALSDGYPELRALVQDPPSNLTFTGIVPREQVCDLLNAADLFFLPSHSEQFSMSILEAAATGTPLLLRDLPPYRTVYAGRYLCGSTAGDFVRVIRELQGDRERLERQGRLSAEISKTYGEQGVYKMWEQAYTRCTAAESGEDTAC